MITKVELVNEQFVLSDRLKTLLRKNYLLLENERFDYLFKVVASFQDFRDMDQAYTDTYMLTKLLYDAGIDVLHEVTAIYPYMFTSLTVDETNIELPPNIKTICEFGFSDSNITRLVIPEVTKYISASAFSYMRSLVELDASKNKQGWILKNLMFFEDAELTTIYLPEGVASLDKQVFYKNPKLKRLVFPGTTRAWKKIKKEPTWHNGCNLKEVECNDGVVKLTGN